MNPVYAFAAACLLFAGCQKPGAQPAVEVAPSDQRAPSSTPTREQVEAAIAKAGHCATDADCVALSPTCPFGCGIVVNKAEAQNIEQLLQTWTGQNEACAYRCRKPEAVACTAGKCTAGF